MREDYLWLVVGEDGVTGSGLQHGEGCTQGTGHEVSSS